MPNTIVFFIYLFYIYKICLSPHPSLTTVPFLLSRGPGSWILSGWTERSFGGGWAIINSVFCVCFCPPIYTYKSKGPTFCNPQIPIFVCRMELHHKIPRIKSLKISWCTREHFVKKALLSWRGLEEVGQCYYSTIFLLCV